MQKTIQVRGILPPGIEKNSKVIFGIMWIRLGKLTLTEPEKNRDKNHRVLIQFWGEREPVILQPENTVSPVHNRMHEYEIRCPVLNFQKYLLDMKNNLKIEVQGEGTVTIDFKSLLVKNANHSSRSAFDHFRSSFWIMRKGKRIGNLEIEMASNFNPMIMEVQAQQKGQQLKNAVEILARDKPWLLEQVMEEQRLRNQKPFVSVINDPRIPHSLQTRQEDDRKFDPNQYEEEQPKMIKMMKEEPLDLPRQVSNKESPKRAGIVVIDPDEEIPKQLDLNKRILIQPVEQPIKRTPRDEQFAPLQRILTYSNLKLRDSEPIPEDLSPIAAPAVRLQESIKKKIDQNELQIKKNQELRREFYGDMLPIDKSQVDIVDSMPKSEEVPKIIQRNPVKIQRIEIQESERPKEIQVEPTPLLSPPVLLSPCAPILPNPKIVQTMNNLLLNLYVEVKNIRLPSLFYVMHKVYGQAERTRIDYRQNTPIIIMCAIGISQLKIMDKVPFIVEFWDTKKNAFIGTARVDLIKVKQGFLMAGAHINEKAIKANVLPTVVHRGNIELSNLKKETVGEAWMHVMIGTSSQLNTYLNDQREQEKPREIEAKQQPQPQQNQITRSIQQPQQPPTQAVDIKLDLLDLFSQFLHHLNSNHSKLTPQLLKLISSKQLDQQSFSSFLSKINKPSFLPLFSLFNYKSRIHFPIQLISESFDDFSQLYQSICRDYEDKSKQLKKLLTQQAWKSMESNSQFNLISKDKFLRILTQYSNKTAEQVAQLLKYHHEDFISLSKIKLDMQNKPNQIRNKTFQEQILNETKQNIKNNDIRTQDILGQLRSTERLVHIDDLSRLFGAAKCRMSFWRLLLLIDKIKQIVEDRTSSNVEISYAGFYNWFSEIKKETEKEREEEQRKKMQLRLKKSELKVDPSNVKANIHEEDISNLGSLVKQALERRQSQGAYVEPDPSNLQPSVVQPSKIEPSQPSQPEPSNPSAMPSQLAQTTKYWRHSFSIQTTELSLEHPQAGSCHILYRFPHEQEEITSKVIHLNNDKFRYEVKMLGRHSVVLDLPLSGYIGQEIVLFRVLLNGEEMCQAALPADQLLIDPGSQVKILALFSQKEESPQMVGKLRIKLTYGKEPSSDHFIGKETTTSMFLPKNGYLSVDISSVMDSNKLSNQMKIKQDFYCFMQFDLFPMAKQLQQAYKPLQSRLHSTLTENLHLRDDMKIKLTQQIIDYFKNKMCRISLMACYYQRIEGMPRKQLLTLGTIEIPLLSIITGRGIDGDYAFKNKYGIFVALAQCKISYGKSRQLNQTTQLNQQSIIEPLKSEKIFILLNFIELLSQERQIKYVTFEYFKRKIRQSTNRININSWITQLHTSIMIELTSEQLYEQTYLSLELRTNKKQQMFVDINTRPIMEALNKTKSTAFSNYFTVSTEHEIVDIRVGLKIYALRGYQVKNFLQAIKQNLSADVFQELDIPSELDNYQKMLDIYRGKLKIPKNQFEQYLQEMLSNRQRLNIEFMTNRIHFRLDLNQFKAKNSQDIDKILNGCQTLAMEQDKMAEIVEQAKIINLKQQFLNKFTFKQLDQHRLDRNADLHELSDYVDVMVLLRKIEVLAKQKENQNNQNSLQESNISSCQYVLRLVIEKGKGMEILYNGIKPNSIVRCPTLDIETELFERQSSPEYNLQAEFQIESQELSQFKKLEFQVYHRLTVDGDSEELLIGHGKLDISNLLYFKGDSKSSAYTVILTPEKTYAKGKAELKIRAEIERVERGHEMSQEAQSPNHLPQVSQMDTSNQPDISRIARILKEDVRVGRQMLFESSQEDD